MHTAEPKTITTKSGSQNSAGTQLAFIMSIEYIISVGTLTQGVMLIIIIPQKSPVLHTGNLWYSKLPKHCYLRLWVLSWEADPRAPTLPATVPSPAGGPGERALHPQAVWVLVLVFNAILGLAEAALLGAAKTVGHDSWT